MPNLSTEQITKLLRPVTPSRVKQKQGKFSYLESWDVIAMLTRIFGFEGWDIEVDAELMFDEAVAWTDDNNRTKEGYDVCYRAKSRLTIRNLEGQTVKVCEDVATGVGTHQPHRADAHDLALKAAVSDATKRAARNLGDQFGLSLYDDSSLNPVVRESMAYPDIRSGPAERAQEALEDPRTPSPSPRPASQAPPGSSIKDPSKLTRRIYAICKAHNVKNTDIISQVVRRTVTDDRTISFDEALAVNKYLDELYPPS